MVAPPTVWDVTLTGRTRHRPGLFGKQILQVEEKRQTVRLTGVESEERGGFYTQWRDAKWDDIEELRLIGQKT